jgi:hypothetical protein
MEASDPGRHDRGKPRLGCIGAARESGDVKVTEVDLQVAEVGADAEHVERIALLLCQEIADLDVNSVQPTRTGQAPSGARGVDAATVGALVVSLTPALEAVGNLVTAVVEWLRRSGAQRTVRMRIGDDELELTGANSKTQQRLIEEWIHAHALE